MQRNNQMGNVGKRGNVVASIIAGITAVIPIFLKKKGDNTRGGHS